MGNIFKVAEVVDMGIEKEKKRRDFYAQAAEKFQKPELKDLFTRLRDWEETHIKKFSQIKSRVDKTKTMESYPGELKSYIDAFVNDKLYEDINPDSFAQKVDTPSTALQYGIGFEKDAILFFSELLPFMDSTNKDAVEELIEEEKKHLAYLHQLREKLEG